MTFRRARGVAFQLAALLALTFAVSGPASAATAPSVTLRQLSTDLVSVSGRTATATARVRVERYTSSGWAVVRRTRAHQHRYATGFSMAAGSTATFRVVSNRRSRKFVVRMPPAPVPTRYDACGARPLKADGTAWSCSFHDDFATNVLDRTKWLPQTSFVSGSASALACYLDDPSTVSVANGSLNLSVRKVSAPVSCSSSSGVRSTDYVAGMVTSYHLFSQQYGRVEARIRNTGTTYPGLQESFWLWPDDRAASTDLSPYTGEIDVSETYSVYPNLSVPYLHYSSDGPLPGTNTAWDCTAYRGQWNTYTLEWSASRLEIWVNGKSCLVNTSGDPAFQQPYIIAFTEALGTTGNEYDGRAPLPATMSIDYVRAWK